MKFYRASSSTRKTLKGRGFKPFKPLDPHQISELLEYLNGGAPVTSINRDHPGLSLYVKKLLETTYNKLLKRDQRRDLGTLSQTIRNAGSHNYDAFWVSMSLDPDCKGQVLGRTVYQVELDMRVRRPLGHGLWQPSNIEAAKAARTPFVLYNNAGTHFALLHCQEEGKVEVSFLNTIPGTLVFPALPSKAGRVVPRGIRT